MTQAVLPDGTTLNFPDETPDEIIQGKVKEYLAQQQQPSQGMPTTVSTEQPVPAAPLPSYEEVQAVLPDGTTLNFPKDTSEEVIQGKVKEYLAKQRAPTPAAKESSFLKEAGKAIKRNVKETFTLFKDLPEVTKDLYYAGKGALTDQDLPEDRKQHLIELNKKLEAIDNNPELRAAVGSYKDVIDDPSKFAQWAANAASIIPDLLGGVATGVGKGLAKKAITSVAKKEAAKLTAEEVAKQKAKDLGQGILAYNLAKTLPSEEAGIFEETGQVAPKTALASSAVQAYLDKVGDLKALGVGSVDEAVAKAVKDKGFFNKLLTKVGKAAKGGLAEGATEVAQAVISEATPFTVDSDKAKFDLDNVVNQGLLGLMGGAAVRGGVELLRGGDAQERYQPKEELVQTIEQGKPKEEPTVSISEELPKEEQEVSLPKAVDEEIPSQQQQEYPYDLSTPENLEKELILQSEPVNNPLVNPEASTQGFEVNPNLYKVAPLIPTAEQGFVGKTYNIPAKENVTNGIISSLTDPKVDIRDRDAAASFLANTLNIDYESPERAPQYFHSLTKMGRMFAKEGEQRSLRLPSSFRSSLANYFGVLPSDFDSRTDSEIAGDALVEYVKLKDSSFKERTPLENRFIASIPADTRKYFDNLLEVPKQVKAQLESQGVYTPADIFVNKPSDKNPTGVPNYNLLDTALQETSHLGREQILEAEDAQRKRNQQDISGLLKTNVKPLTYSGNFFTNALTEVGSFAYNFAADHSGFAKVFYWVTERKRLMESYIHSYVSLLKDDFFKAPRSVQNTVGDIAADQRLLKNKAFVDNEGNLNYLKRDEETGQIDHVKTSDPLVINAYVALQKAMKQAIEDNISLAKKQAINALNKAGLGVNATPAQFEIYRARRKSGKIPQSQAVTEAQLESIRRYFDSISDREQFNSRDFVPFSRFGARGKAVYRKNPDGSIDRENQEFFSTYETNLDDSPVSEDQYNRFKDQFKKYEDNPDKYWVSEEYNLTKDALKKDLMRNPQVSMAMISQLFSMEKNPIFANTTFSAEDLKTLEDILHESLGTRGYISHFSKADEVPGYSRDWSRVISAYIQSTARYLGNAATEGNIMEEANNLIHDSNESRGVTEYTRNFVNTILNPTNQVSNFVQGMKQLQFIGAFGGNVKTMIMQFASLLNTVPTQLAYLTDSTAITGLIRVMREIAKSPRLMNALENPEKLNLLVEKGILNEEEATILKQQYDNGLLNPRLSSEEIAPTDYEIDNKTGKIKSTVRSITHLAGLGMRYAESYMRVLTAIAAIRTMSRNPGKTIELHSDLMKNDAFYNNAMAQRGFKSTPDKDLIVSRILQQSLGSFGKESNTPWLNRNASSFITPFSSYVFQAVANFMRNAKGRYGWRGRRAALNFLLLSGIFGGIKSLPFEQSIMLLANIFGKLFDEEDKDYEKELELWLKNNPYTPDGLATFIMGGLLDKKYTGKDVSGSLRMDAPLLPDLLKVVAGQSAFDADKFGGMPGGMLTNIGKAGSEFLKNPEDTDLTQLLVEAQPIQALKNPILAAKFAKEGKKYRGEMSLLPGENTTGREVVPEVAGKQGFAGDLGNFASRAAGFKPEEQAAAEEAIDRRMRLKTAVRYKPFIDSRKAKLKEVFKRIALAKDPEIKASLNNKLEEILKEIGGTITAKKIPLDGKDISRWVQEAQIEAYIRLPEQNAALTFKKLSDEERYIQSLVEQEHSQK